tara:strand:+ start:541 stop:948 length:408 start_codon:yes stop_codon:yes gene_type:complete
MSALEIQAIDSTYELAGQLLWVPDRQWGFSAVGREDHPGLCCGTANLQKPVIMLRGTSSLPPKRYENVNWIMEPNAENGLNKTTSFRLEPKPFKRRRIEILIDNRHIGSIPKDDLEAINQRLVQICAVPMEANVE